MVKFSYDPDDKITTAAFAGRLDTQATQTLPDVIKANLPARGIGSGEKVVFDMKEVEYISSSFLRICVLVAKQAGAGHFCIVHCQPAIKTIFKMSGLDDLLHVS